MKLTCEVCGGPIMMISGGKLAVCKDCGTEYTLERMKEMAAAARAAERSPEAPEEQPLEDFPEDQRSLGDIPEDMYPENQRPLGDIPEDMYPENQRPLGDIPEDMYPGNQRPLGDIPEDMYPENQRPLGDIPEDMYPENQRPLGDIPEDMYPEGQRPLGDIQEDMYPEGQRPLGDIQEDMYPEGQRPLGDIPDTQDPDYQRSGPEEPEKPYPEYPSEGGARPKMPAASGLMEEVEEPRSPGSTKENKAAPAKKKRSGKGWAAGAAVALLCAIGAWQNGEAQKEAEKSTLPEITAPALEDVFTPVSSSSLQAKLDEMSQESVQTYTVTVNGGEGSGTYAVGDRVEIQAARPAENQKFARWETDCESIDVSRIYDTFTMPAEDITLTAVFTYDVPPEELYTDDEIRIMADNVWSIHLTEEGYEKYNDLFFFESADRSQAGFGYYASGEKGISWAWNEYLTSIEKAEDEEILAAAEAAGVDPDSVELYVWEEGYDTRYIAHLDNGNLIFIDNSGTVYELTRDNVENYIAMRPLHKKWYEFEYGA